jgi:hypothetical protein
VSLQTLQNDTAKTLQLASCFASENDAEIKAAAEVLPSRRLGDPKLSQGFERITSQIYRLSGRVARTP